MAPQDEVLLRLNNLKTYFYTERGVVKAVDGVTISLRKGETLALVGESGSGKTVTSLSILRLVPQPGGRIVDGEIFFKGKDLLKKTEKEMRAIRGSQMTMVPQDPMTSLNPVYRIGDQVGEPLAFHKHLTGSRLANKILELLKMVNIPSPQRRMREYPHQFSGGMKQRVMIAMCLSCEPDLIIADEPTTALDVSIQAQILDLLRELQMKLATSILFITHDLGVVAEMCSRVAVMYAGVVVEQADVRTIFKRAKHPYTQGLIDSIPKIGEIKGRLHMIEGQPPNMLQLPQGCRFSPRCPHGLDQCKQEEPTTEWVSQNHEIRCFRWREL